MVSELATNAVKHAHSDFKISIDDSGGEIRVEVSDTGRGQFVLRSPASLEPSGRGLRIVEALSGAWGTAESPHGKSVWFALPSKATAAV
jgi:anti-sigma regulatory factor (Ser/Thr protein kinase)